MVALLLLILSIFGSYQITAVISSYFISASTNIFIAVCTKSTIWMFIQILSLYSLSLLISFVDDFKKGK